MGRIYTVSIQAATGDATTLASNTAYDLFSVSLGPSGTPIYNTIGIHSLVMGQRTVTTWEGHSLEFWRYSSTFTAPSGGNSVTPRPMTINDSASVATVRTVDTTAAASGTSVKLLTDEFIYLNNHFWLPPPEDRPIIGPGQAFVVRWPAITGTAIAAFGATLTYEELV